LGVWLEGVDSGYDVLLVFEDDARPAPEALPVLFEEITKLEVLGVPWDLIYLRSGLYDNADEKPCPGTHLWYCGHRKATDAYALSLTGLQKLANSGFCEAIFAVDDFLPAVYTGHPRPDIQQLPCVQQAKGESGFHAFTLHNNLCANAQALVDPEESDTTMAPVVLGTAE